MNADARGQALQPSLGWLEELPAGVVVIADGRMRYANAAAERLMACAPQTLVGRAVADFVHPLDLHRVLARLQRAEHDAAANPPTEFRVYDATGRQLVLAMTSCPVTVDGRGAVLASFVDMTERAAMEARLQETDQNFQRIMNTMQDVFYRTDAQGITRYVCPAVKNVLGYAAEEIIGLPAAAFYPDPEEREALVTAIRTQGFVHDFPGRMRRRDGSIIDISISTQALLDENGRYAGVEGIWRDITQRKSLERELQRLATRDALTGLPNRRSILASLEQAMARRGGRRDAAPLTVLLFDLDHFKRINDRHGHAAGDAALVEMARLIETLSRAGDNFGRFGGEEFLLLLDDADAARALEVAERIRRGVEQARFEVGPRLLEQLTLSIGVAEYRADDGRPSDLLERADRALYQAKDAGRNRIEVAPPVRVLG